MSTKKSKNKGTVLVIGGGIAGTAVAESLGQAGMSVHLVEKQENIGGHVNEMGCKASDVCMRCNVCVANEILRNVYNTPNVFLHTSTELIELQNGSNGSRYTAVLKHNVPPGNGDSKKIPSYPLYMRKHTEEASKGGQNSFDVDAIVIATGYEPYNPIENSSYGYNGVSNIITGTDAERQLAKKHKITRVTDGKQPERIAFVQCVGSRTEEIYRRPEDTDYCSTVCCAYALRMARLMKYQAEESQITIFYMDIQHIGTGFNAFYMECREKMRFVRSRPYEIRAQANGVVCVTYAPESEGIEGGEGVCREEFDLVILAVGIRPPSDGWKLADKLGVAIDEQGFFGLKGASSLPDLQREGIYVVGACESPKDIAGSIAQAEAVSAVILSGQRGLQ